ncbi:MAG: SagB/ThcOx family dehydrogenase [Minisyncoccota bacterium]
MSSFLAHLRTHLRRVRMIASDAAHTPHDVPVGLHKEYKRMERIALPTPISLDYSLQDALARRHSTMSSETGVPLTLEDLGTLLGSALRKHAKGIRRPYPSGGGLYPVETYLVATQTDGIEPGVFHYHPTEHALERLWALPRDFVMKQLVNKPDFLSPSALIIFTSIWQRSAIKYGDLAFLHALIEAGHMGENILLMATSLGLETRPYAGFNDDLLARTLDLDGEIEQPIYSITLSKLSRLQGTHTD